MNTDPIPCPRCNGEGRVKIEIESASAATPALPPRLINCDLCEGFGKLWPPEMNPPPPAGVWPRT
jgi:hypothetical protein